MTPSPSWRARMATPNPTEGELAILRVLWARKAPMTVREVHKVLSRGKDTAYTTVLKMLTIMAEKRLVHRDESERSHTYWPMQAEPAMLLVPAAQFVVFLQAAGGSPPEGLLPVMTALRLDAAANLFVRKSSPLAALVVLAWLAGVALVGLRRVAGLRAVAAMERGPFQ